MSKPLDPPAAGAHEGWPKRKRLLKQERKQMEREIGAGAEEEQAKLADGWTKSPDGHWVPHDEPPAPSTPRDSM